MALSESYFDSFIRAGTRNREHAFLRKSTYIEKNLRAEGVDTPQLLRILLLLLSESTTIHNRVIELITGDEMPNDGNRVHFFTYPLEGVGDFLYQDHPSNAEMLCALVSGEFIEKFEQALARPGNFPRVFLKNEKSMKIITRI